MAKKIKIYSQNKTMILIDATGSMLNTIEKVKTTISTMFKRINLILEANNVNK